MMYCIVFLQEVDLAAQTMQERSDLQKMTEKLAASVERRIFAEGRERSSKELLSVRCSMCMHAGCSLAFADYMGLLLQCPAPPLHLPLL